MQEVHEIAGGLQGSRIKNTSVFSPFSFGGIAWLTSELKGYQTVSSQEQLYPRWGRFRGINKCHHFYFLLTLLPQTCFGPLLDLLYLFGSFGPFSKSTGSKFLKNLMSVLKRNVFRIPFRIQSVRKRLPTDILLGIKEKVTDTDTDL